MNTVALIFRYGASAPKFTRSAYSKTEAKIFVSLLLSIILTLYTVFLVLPFIDRVYTSLEGCELGLLYEKSPQDKGSGIGDIVNFANCLLLGYYTPETKDLAVSAFLIFHIILPFIYFCVFMYKFPLIPEWFVGKKSAKVLNLLIAIYAARIGGFMLISIGYLAFIMLTVFIYILFLNKVLKMIDRLFSD